MNLSAKQYKTLTAALWCLGLLCVLLHFKNKSDCTANGGKYKMLNFETYICVKDGKILD